MVATARHSWGMSPAAAKTAAPPKLWPTSKRGASYSSRKNFAAAEQVADIRRKIGVGEIAFGRAQPGEIEPQNREPARRQSGGDIARRKNIFGASEAVGEKRVSARRVGGRFEARRRAARRRRR